MIHGKNVNNQIKPITVQVALMLEILFIFNAGCGNFPPSDPEEIEILRRDTLSATNTTVATWNLHHGVGLDGRYDLTRVVNTIKNSGTHVVALQEVDRYFRKESLCDDMAASIVRIASGSSPIESRLHGSIRKFAASGSGGAWTLVFAPALNWNGDLFECGWSQGRQYGPALLVNGTTDNEQVLYMDYGGERRALLCATARPVGTSSFYRFCSTHLDHRDADIRKAQTRAVYDFITTGRWLPDKMILGGDFNSASGSDALMLISSWLTPHTDSGIDILYRAFWFSFISCRTIVSPASDHNMEICSYNDWAG